MRNILSSEQSQLKLVIEIDSSNLGVARVEVRIGCVD
jgi:hypothetical protein